MITTFLFLLLGCSTEQTAYQQSTNRDWELYIPAFDHEPLMPSVIRWTADPRIIDDLQAAMEEWELHLSCGIDFRQVNPSEQVDLTFECADFEIVLNREASSLNFPDRGHVTVSKDACSRGGIELARHATGHALGLKHKDEWFETRMGGVSLVLEQMHGKGTEMKHDLDPMEIDGLRYWALQHGAPRCGDREIRWSWFTHPHFYNEETTEEIVSHLDASITLQ